MDETFRSSQFYKELFHSLPLGLAVNDMQGQLLEVNQAYADIIGYSIEETLKLTYWDVTPKKYSDQEQEQLEALNSTGFYGPYEKEYIHKSGKLIPVRLNGRIIESNGQSFIWSSVEDISSRKAIEDELKDSQEFLNETTSIAKVGGWAIDLKTNELSWTDEVYRIHELDFDFKPDVEKAIQFYHPDYLQAITDAVQLAIEKGDPFDMEAQIITGKGNTLWVEAKGKPVFDKGQAVKIIGTFQDISFRKKNELERRELERILVQNEKMLSLGGLAAGMAHEINNPLAGILQTTSVLIKRLETLENGKSKDAAEEAGTNMEAIKLFMEKRDVFRMLNSISESGKRASDIIHNMLSFARQSDNEFSSHSIEEMIDSALKIAATDYNLKKNYDFKSIAVEKKLDPDLPPLICEKTKIQQVILNILSNGAAAMHGARTAKPRFIISGTQSADEGGKLVLRIENNGPPIPEENQQLIFDPFYTTKPEGEGTGLGLSVSYFIIKDLHKGDIKVESCEPGCTAFIITLPLQ